MIPSPRLGFFRGVFLANHLASTDNLTRTTKRQNTYQRKLAIYKSGPNKQQHNKETILRQRQREPGLVAFYNIQPGNGAGLYLQPRSLHGALQWKNKLCGRSPQYAPPLWPWPFDLESGVRVTCDMGYLCANFSLPMPLCSRLRPDVATDRRQTSHSIIA